MQYYLYIFERCCGYQCVFISHFLWLSLCVCAYVCVSISHAFALFFRLLPVFSSSLSSSAFFLFCLHFCRFIFLLMLIVCICLFLHRESSCFESAQPRVYCIHSRAHTPCCLSKSVCGCDVSFVSLCVRVYECMRLCFSV